MSSRFLLLWMGQLISLLGSSLTGFGVSLWLYDQTKSPYLLSVAIFVKMAPSIYLSLFAGHWLDQWRPKTVLLFCNSALLLITLCMWGALAEGALHVPLLFTLLFCSGVVESFQNITFQLTTADFNKPEFYLRSQGLVSLVENSPMLIAPVLGAIAYQALGLKGIVALDAISFAAVLLFIATLEFPAHVAKAKKPFDWLGPKMIWSHALLSKLQLFFMASNFLNGLAGGLVAAYILSRSLGSESALATTQVIMAVGTVAGSVWVWKKGLPGSMIAWITLGTLVAALTGRIGVALGASLLVWSVGLGFRSFLVPLISSANQTLWLKVVPRENMGAVFGARRVFGQGLYPPAVYIGGWLTKSVFIDGAGPAGSGLAAMFLAVGAVEVLTGLLGYLALRSAGRED